MESVTPQNNEPMSNQRPQEEEGKAQMDDGMEGKEAVVEKEDAALAGKNKKPARAVLSEEERNNLLKGDTLKALLEEEKNPKIAQAHEDMNDELDVATKKLKKKQAKMAKRQDEKNGDAKSKIKTEEVELVNAKKAALQSIDEARFFEKNVEVVRDDSYNKRLMERISAVEEKIDQLDLIFTQLLSRGRFIGREQEILPWISSVLQLIVQLFHKVNLEAFRIGVLNRQLRLPDTQTMQLETTFEWINVCKVQFDITAKIFKLILAFMRTYVNNSFNIVMYVNMNRVIKSEFDIILIHKEMRTLMRKANFFRLQNVIFTKYFAHKWAQTTRDSMNAMANKTGIAPTSGHREIDSRNENQ